MLSHNALVVVADGHSATLYRNMSKSGIELKEAEQVTPKSLADQSPSNAPEESSPKQEDEATFAAQVAERLNRLVLGHKAEEVAVIADPTTLGVMRKHYHKELQSRLVKEVAKTLTNADTDAIAKALK